jgi:DNA-directed RNA polymerase subunit E'/Rpb7
MFERRELVRVLNVGAKHLQRNIQSSLLSQIKSQVEGRCGTEGYVQPNTSVILEYSVGNVNILRSGTSYRVRFQADICYPHKGQILKVPVTFRSKIGVHAEMSPLRVLLPRDLHIANTEFEQIQEKDELELEVLGAEFKQNDEQIFVLGKLIKRIPAAAPTDTGDVQSVVVPTIEDTKTASKSSDGGDEVKSVRIVEPSESSTTARKEPVRRKRRLGGGLEPASTLQLNVGGDNSVAFGDVGSK